ncbi:MAG: radical SAM/SPASM domain-containing protein [Nisaea sp.]|uniref:radical SAM/SPASM domain-containing protein n=1 Tax=Nisaea sp. TaxID=2024842 RepID=UPI001B1A0BF5|nr:radical SAM/SPASM domain-containing protein [Nisaea sp.]MBO6560137.1 radical SAM/SPASM domain-containing protein [Nisaea sp.]
MGITERIDRVTKMDPNYRKALPPAPRSVKIELTARCNLACTFCARSMSLRQHADMDRAFFERLTVDMRQAGVEELGLFYLGESFLLPWLADAVRFAKEEAGFPYVFLTTNGTVSTPERVEAAIRAGLDSLKFSMNYADAGQFQSVAQVKPKLYAAIERNLRSAAEVRDRVYAETGHRCGIYASYIEYDGEQGDRMRETVARIAEVADEVYALPLYNQASLVTEREKAQGWAPTAGNRGRSGALRDALPCWSIFTEGHVTWDGQLSACCFDHDGRFHMGDLTATPFLEAWHSERFKELREAHLRQDVSGTPCEACVAYQ